MVDVINFVVFKLRIGVFYPTLNVYGGGEFVAAVISNTLAQNNYSVTFFTNKRINQREVKQFFGQGLHRSLKVIANPSIVQPKGLLDFYQTIFRSYIFKSKCDIWIDVYSNRIFPWTNVTYIHYPFLNHNFYKPKFPYIKSGHLLPIGGLPYAVFEKNLINDNKKLILANSRYTADEIKRFSGKKAIVLYPPVPSTFFSKNLDFLNNFQRENLVITISRLGPGKGLEKIPYIASLTDEDIRFVIVGRLHYKNTLLSLQKLIKELGLADRIKIFPDISIDDMKNLLKKAKVCLHTMVGEHFGISIVQAMAMGCVPIVHDSGGAREFVPENYRYNDMYEAAAKITKEIYAWSPSKAKQMISIAERFKEENFSKEFMKLFKQYEESIL